MSHVSQDFRRSAVQAVRALIKEAAQRQVFLRKTLLKVAREEQSVDENGQPILSSEDRIFCTNRLHAIRVNNRPTLRRHLAILALLRGVSCQRMESNPSTAISCSSLVFVLDRSLSHLPGYQAEKEALHAACNAWLQGNDKAIFPIMEAAQ